MRLPQCQFCDYDLSGTPRAGDVWTCPECGRTTEGIIRLLPWSLRHPRWAMTSALFVGFATQIFVTMQFANPKWADVIPVGIAVHVAPLTFPAAIVTIWYVLARLQETKMKDRTLLSRGRKDLREAFWFALALSVAAAIPCGMLAAIFSMLAFGFR